MQRSAPQLRQVVATAFAVAASTLRLAAQAIPEAGVSQTVIFPSAAALDGEVINRSPLAWTTADGNGATEDFLLSYSDASGVAPVGQLVTAGGTILGFPGDIVRVGSLAYGVDTNLRFLYTVDLGTALCTKVGAAYSSVYTTVYSLAYDAPHDRLFAVDLSHKQLLLFNRSTGFPTPIGSGTLGGYPQVRSLAYRASNDRLYAVDQSTSMLLQIDPTTGAVTPVVTVTPVLNARIEELEFWGDDLYGVLGGLSSGVLVNGQLVRIDLGSGVLTDVGPQIPYCSPHCLLLTSVPETSLWSLQSGPGQATFADPTQLDTTVSFSTPGVYTLELSVFSPGGSISDSLTVISDGCPNDPSKIVPGVCGCGVPDTDADGDGWLDCVDNCATIYNPDQADADGDGLGDACESGFNGSAFCAGDGSASSCPCLAFGGPGQGCRNSTGVGAVLANTGGASIALDDAMLVTTQLPPDKQGLVFMGSGMKNGGLGTPFADGLKCVSGNIHRFHVTTASAQGQITLAHPVAASGSLLAAGSTWYFQTWYRDSANPCGHKTNLSNGWRLTFAP
jgi:hypothetical protein